METPSGRALQRPPMGRLPPSTKSRSPRCAPTRETAAEQVSIPVFAVGGIRTAAEVRACLDDGAAMVGIGRPFYAEADLAARILAGDAEPRLCRNSNKCVPAQMLGMRGACYNPEVNKQAKQRAVR